ncbi:MAG: protein kinase [Elusimicrobiaceae bacterium]|nr:protein kinase [Elusimicrobiaceae bacterium]
MRLSKVNLFIYAWLAGLLLGATSAVATPLLVPGNFSARTDLSSSATVFDQAARNAEVEALNNLLREKQFDAVISRINQLTLQNYRDDRFYLLLAIAYDGLNRYDDVIYAAGQAIAVAPQDARAYVLRAGAYLQKEQYERCQMDLDAALRFNPQSRLAQKIQAQLNEKTFMPKPQQEEKPKTRSTRPLSGWLIVYFAVVLIAIFLYVYWRYEEVFRRPKNAFTKKEVEVKEQYDFIRQIGEGGMGKVYEAYDKALKRKVAIKRVRPELVRSAYVREQFLAEARMVALLRHPCIVEIYTVIESESALYLVFEYVDGQTLETRLDIDGRLPFSQVKQIFEYVCRGLQYAHSQDIIHCDLKPGNIMIYGDDNKAKVMDFGVAKRAIDHETGARTVAGTPAYMAPEQQKGFMRKQSDVYSLALCLYEALVGQVPWSVKGFDIARKKIVPASQVAPQIPPAVDALLEDALKEDPKERVQSIEEFWNRLKVIEPLEENLEQTHY